MIRLFKPSLWIMSGSVVFAMISFGVIAWIGLLNPLIWIPILIIIIASVISQVSREKYLYNDAERKKELSEKIRDYDRYVLRVRNVLRNNGIDTPEKITKLKTECETVLKTNQEKFTIINNKIFDMFIGVPLGALIASIIYADSTTAQTEIAVLIFLGLIILAIVTIARLINYYSEGYSKDKYLLDALNELDYSEEVLDAHIH